ncbi:MAG: ABC transporter ATP-binding protein [Armatimonadota bacterium]|nr:ABC transporter ATP-binding protein [Armatimonadota bacterium]MDR7486694.1 ABC transporter ATP-binding protein [Armatimonadota bacterium]MDR7533740.1 ABC transporter ATP-binding protein [Armatimonadota bacterium]MDR7535053.1 ABC transporter ATP-binding protein [Armatimonadota bacterium]
MRDAPDAVVQAEALTKRYGTLLAVDGITFAVRRGECFGFLGPNGAGKTTTMKMIYCVLPPTAGALHVLGRDVRADARAIKARLGVVAQENTLDSALTVRENLVVFGRYFDLPWAVARRRADELLAFVALADRANDRVETLSGGMRRRLMVARALIADPELLILDEPTTGLDPQARQLTWEKLRELKRRGVTQILTTHYMEEAAALCDRLVIMDRSRIVAEGAPADLIRAHVGREVVELHGLARDGEAAPGLDRALAAAAGLADAHEVAGDLVLFYTADGEALLHRIRAAGVDVEAATLRRATLEDVFLKLTGRMLRD